jgi:hypothetical protein
VSRSRSCRSGLVIAAVVAVAAGGCGDDRPSTSEWRATWEEVQATIPARSTLQTPPSTETCRTVLGELRSQRPRLTPAPDDLVGSASAAWAAYAEHVFFGCFGEGTRADVTEAYRTLRRLATEVEAALSAD